jgi:AAA domain-containing protein
VSWEPLNLAAPEYAKPAEPPYGSGLLYRGKRHAISGPPEAAKTLLALILGLEHTRVDEGPIALIDFEMGPNGSRLMLQDLGATIDEIASVLYFEPDRAPDLDAISLITDAGVTLAIIDSASGAYDASGLDDMKRKDTETFYRAWTKQLWQRGIASVLIDHVTKNAETRGKFAIGSERKLGTVDVHLGLTVVKQLHRGSAGLIKIHTHKDRPAYLQRPTAAELQLESDADTHAITWTFRPPAETTSNGFRPTVLMERVSQFLLKQTEPVSRNVVEKGVTGEGTYVRLAMDKLVAEGYAVEERGPRRARLLTATRPFTSSSSDLVVTSSDEDGSHFVSSSLPLQGDEDEDEVKDEHIDTDEVERLAELARSMHQ